MHDLRHSLIYKYIRISCISKIFIPIIPILISYFLLTTIPFKEIITPIKVNNLNDVEELYLDGTRYVEIYLERIYYSGYDRYDLLSTGSYYYDIENNLCSFILLDGNSSSKVPPIIHKKTIKAKLIKTDHIYDGMLKSLSKDLDWTYNDLDDITSNIVVSEQDYHLIKYIFILIFLILLTLYSIKTILLNSFYLLFPHYYPPCRNLKKIYKDMPVRSIIAMVNNELETNVTIHSADIYITDNFFIELTNLGITILPLDQIIWCFKHSTWNKSLSVLKNRLSYNLIIYTYKFKKLTLTSKEKNDLDYIIEYLENNFEYMLIGYNKTNKDIAKNILKGKMSVHNRKDSDTNL